MAFIEFTFRQITEDTSDLLVALLADLGCTGFEQRSDTLIAFAGDAVVSADAVRRIASQFGVPVESRTVADQNWNHVWESNFEPVVIDGFCRIRAHFHPADTNILHDILITPKMSFGTGHHATTHMMIAQMQNIDMQNKAVLDFGTGTGVLAILAAKLGAAPVVAIDNDPWSISNATENFLTNGTGTIDVVQSNHAGGQKLFDVILANITKNVIVENMALFAAGLRRPGQLLISGLLQADHDEVAEAAGAFGFEIERMMERSGWISLLLRR